MQRSVIFLARAMAMIGGAVLTLLIVLTCVSVTGRLLNSILHTPFSETLIPHLSEWFLDLGVGPILGDFELVEAGVAFAIFAFLPLCQIMNGHATVDIFTSRFPASINRVIQMIVDIAFALVLILIAWRLFEGMQDKMRYNETTFLLQMPVWWSYAASFAAATLAALVAVYVAAMRVVEALSGRAVLPGQEGVDG